MSFFPLFPRSFVRSRVGETVSKHCGFNQFISGYEPFVDLRSHCAVSQKKTAAVAQS